MGTNGIAPAVTFTTNPMPPLTGFEFDIISNTHRHYGRPAKEVDAEILTRHKAAERRERPSIGRADNE